MTASEQAAYLSLPRKRESSIIPQILLSPKVFDFSGAPIGKNERITPAPQVGQATHDHNSQSDKLAALLAQPWSNTACQERLEIIEKAMMQQESVTEALKAANQMEWMRLGVPALICEKPTQPEREPAAWAFCIWGYSLSDHPISVFSLIKEDFSGFIRGQTLVVAHSSSPPWFW